MHNSRSVHAAPPVKGASCGPRRPGVRRQGACFVCAADVQSMVPSDTATLNNLTDELPTDDHLWADQRTWCTTAEASIPVLYTPFLFNRNRQRASCGSKGSTCVQAFDETHDKALRVRPRDCKAWCSAGHQILFGLMSCRLMEWWSSVSGSTHLQGAGGDDWSRWSVVPAFLLMKRPVSYDVQPINMELTDRRHHQLYLEKERCWGSGVQHATCWLSLTKLHVWNNGFNCNTLL
jgi:hypothetical protein